MCYTGKATPARHRPERQYNACANRRKQCSPTKTKSNSHPTPPRKRQNNSINGHTPRRMKPTHTPSPSDVNIHPREFALRFALRCWLCSASADVVIFTRESSGACYTGKATPARHRPERQYNAGANRRKQCSPTETKSYANPTPPRKRQNNPTNGHTPRRMKPTHTFQM